jgi:predicted ATP-dependent endonuclease of OLD family
MQLNSARITTYRSIEDSESIRIESDVTSLVGKNESGKTTVLQALFRLKPVETSAILDEDIDFPARLTRQRRQLPQGRRIPVVEAIFEFDEAEIKQIEEDLGVGALKSRTFTVATGYRETGKAFSIPDNEAKVIEHLRSTLDLPAADAAILATTSTVKDLLAKLDALAEPPEAARVLADEIRAWPDQSLARYLIDTYASPLMPKFVYFAEYDSMPGLRGDLQSGRGHRFSAAGRDGCRDVADPVRRREHPPT